MSSDEMTRDDEGDERAMGSDEYDEYDEFDEDNWQCLGCVAAEGPAPIGRDALAATHWIMCGDCVSDTGMALGEV